MTKQVIKSGDSYSVTFGLCLKLINETPKAKSFSNTEASKTEVLVYKLDDRKREELFILSNGDRLYISNDKKTRTYFVNRYGKITKHKPLVSKATAEKILNILMNR